MLRAIVVAVAVLCSRLMPVGCVYSLEECALPSELITTTHHVFTPHNVVPEDMVPGMVPEVVPYAITRCGLIVNSFEKHHSVLLVLDDFQHAFALTGEAVTSSLKQRVSAVCEVATISRCGSTYILIAGSTDMRSLLYRSGSIEHPDPWRVAGFPNFNGTLYKVHTLPGLRSDAELSSYLGTRYPSWHLSRADTAELLYNTGGIGSIIHGAFDAMGGLNAHAVANGVSAAINYLQLSKRAEDRRKALEAAFSTNLNFRIIATYIVTKHQADVEADAGVYNYKLECIGASRDELSAALRAFNDGIDTHNVYQLLVDQCLLYEHEGVAGGCDFQLARPCDAHVYYNETDPTTHELMLYTSVHLMLRGIAHGIEGIHVNLEVLVRCYINVLLPFAAKPTTYRRTRIQINPGTLQLEVILTGEGGWVPLTQKRLDAISGHVVEWRGGTGLHGVILKQANDTTWLIHGWQSHGGHISGKVTGGALQASIDNVVVSSKTGLDLMTADVDDTTSAGMLIKAQIGFCTLIQAWHHTFGAAAQALLPATVFITTTRNAAHAREALAKEGNSMQIHKGVAKSIFTLNEGSPATWKRAVLRECVSIHIEDGVTWLQACLPFRLTTALPLPVVPTAAGAGVEPVHTLGAPAAKTCVVM
jgi:hypothetical protein